MSKNYTRKTANFRISELIKQRVECEGSNIFAEWKDASLNGNPGENKRSQLSIYVVYSYGYHFPLYVYINNKWIGNSSKYSSTTSRHMTQAYPGVCDKYISLKDIMKLTGGTINYSDYMEIAND